MRLPLLSHRATLPLLREAHSVEHEQWVFRDPHYSSHRYLGVVVGGRTNTFLPRMDKHHCEHCILKREQRYLQFCTILYFV